MNINKTWYIGIAAVIVIIAIVVASNLTAKWHRGHYDKAIAAKDAEIQRLLADATDKEAVAREWKDRAKELAQQVAAVGKRIDTLKGKAAKEKTAMETIEVPVGTKAITERLQDRGLHPEVKCE